MVTIEECEQFQQLLEKEYDKVFTHAVVSYVQRVGIKNLVNWMRMNVAEELLAKIPRVEDIPNMEFQRLHAQAENRFLAMLVQSYNDTKPEDLKGRIVEIVAPKIYQLTIKSFPRKK